MAETYRQTGDAAQATRSLETVTQHWLERRQRKQWHRLSSRPHSSVYRQLQSMRTSQEMIEWIQETGIPPNVAIYQTILDGVGGGRTDDQETLKEQAVLAHALLDRILERVAADLATISSRRAATVAADDDDSTTRVEDVGPVLPLPEYSDLSRSFRRVMSCYCRANNIPAAQELLVQLEQWQDDVKKQHPDSDVQSLLFPTKDTNYTIVLTAWAKSGRPHEAEQVLQRLLHRASSENGHALILLRRIREFFESVLNAWVTSCDRTAGQRAELLLVKMMELHQEERGGTVVIVDTNPTIQSFAKAVAAWANSRHPDAPWRADDLLRLVREDVPYWSAEQVASGNFRRALADMHLLVMKMWSSLSKDPRAPEKCRELLMSLDASVGLSHVQTATLQNMYASLLWAWARSGRPDAASNAQNIFVHMEKHREPGGLFATAAAESGGCFQWHKDIYAALLRAYSRAGEGGKAETLLKRMMVEHINLERAGKKGLVSPMNTLNFNEVLLAWSKSKNKPEAERRAEKLFGQMFSKGTGIRPDVMSYNALLSAMSGSTSDETARRGEAYFRRLQQQSLSSPSVGKPDTVTYNRAILLWSKIRTPEALERAQALLDEMTTKSQNDNDPSVQPDLKTYQAFLLILESSAHLSDEERQRRVQQIETAMARLGYHRRRPKRDENNNNNKPAEKAGSADLKEQRRALLFRDLTEDEHKKK